MFSTISRNLFTKRATSNVPASVSSTLSRPSFAGYTNGFAPTRSFSTKKPTTAQSLPIKTPSFIMLEREEAANNGLRPLAAQDNTASVYLESPPAFHEEDKEAAQQLGVNHFYRSGNFTSFFVVKFDPAKEIDMQRYLERVKLDFFSKAPYGTVSDVQLAPQLTEHLHDLFQTEHVESAAILFDKKRLPKEMQRPAELTFIMRTPGGYWNISCHTTYLNMASNKDALIGSLMKNLRVEMKKSKTKVKVPSGIQTRVSGKKRVKPVSVPIGNINLGSTKDLLENSDGSSEFA